MFSKAVLNYPLAKYILVKSNAALDPSVCLWAESLTRIVSAKSLPYFNLEC